MKQEQEMEKLVKKAMKRDEKALEKLLLHYQEYLYRIAYAYLKNEQAALDAVSECVAKIYVNLPRLKEPRYFKTWITKILIHETLDEKRKRMPIVSLENLQEQGILFGEKEEALSREDRMDLYQALDKIPGEYRKILILRYFNDFKIKEIAEIMKIPEGTAKIWLYRGRKRLKSVLMEEMGYEESGI